MIRACTALAIALLLPTDQTAFADGCEGSEDPCDIVPGQRQDTCPAGAICTRTRPELSSAECYTELTDDPNAPISGEFNEPRPNGRRHNGLDLEVRTGTPVFALKAGIVYKVVNGFKEGDRSTPNGNFVRINNDDDTQSVFIHLKEASVQKDDRVVKGDKVGTSNDTGHSEGPHLHYTQWSSTDESQREAQDPTAVHSNCG